MTNTKNTLNTKNISTNIRKLREERNMTMDELSERIGLNTSRMIYDYENGIKRPSLERLIQIAEVFEVSLDSILRSA